LATELKKKQEKSEANLEDINKRDTDKEELNKVNSELEIRID